MDLLPQILRKRVGVRLSAQRRTLEHAQRILVIPEVVHRRRRGQRTIRIGVRRLEIDLQAFGGHLVDHPVHGFAAVLEPTRPFHLIHAVETGKLLDLHMLQGILRRVVDTHFLLVLRADGLVRSATRNSLGARIDQYNAQPAFGRRNGAARARHACADHDDVCIERFSNIGVGDRLRRDFEAPFLGSRLRSQRSVRRCATVRPFAFRRRRRASGQRPHRPQRADRTRALQKVTTIQFHDSLLDPIETTA